MITFNHALFSSFANNALIVGLMSDQVRTFVVTPAQQNILRNIEIVHAIESVTRDELAEFFRSVDVYMFQSPINLILRGLSSPDGSRAYISAHLLTPGSFARAQQTLEHEYMQNLSRWKKADPFRLEAGDYYEERVYQKAIDKESPFCLNAAKATRFY
jgi:hypothetical protein